MRTNLIEQHVPYSPDDMTPCDFFLFPKLKMPFRGTRFESIEAMKKNSTKELKSIPKCIDDWINRWHKCIA